MNANEWQLAVGILVLAAILFIPMWWATWRARRILSRSLGREIREGEENSLSSWMRVSADKLDAGGRELERDLVVRLAGVLEGLESDPLGQSWGEGDQSDADPALRVCPRDRTALTAQLVGPSRFHECSTCHGLWVSGTALRSFLASAQVSLDVPSLKLPAASRATRAIQTHDDAPRCLCNGTTVMERKQRLGVGVDICPHCRAVWLDGGELLELVNGIPRPQEFLEALGTASRSGSSGVWPGLFGGGRSGGGGGGAKW